MSRIKNFIRRHFLGWTVDEIELDSLKSRGLRVGSNTAIHGGCHIDGGWPWLISIGDHVTISTNVTILAHDASPNIVGQATKLGRVRIGNHVFIGTGTVILCGVTLGDNVVVGAGSVVAGDLPGNAVYAGVPARRLCSIEEYREKCAKLRHERPDFSTIHPWNQWGSATEAEKRQMWDALESGIGFV